MPVVTSAIPVITSVRAPTGFAYVQVVEHNTGESGRADKGLLKSITALGGQEKLPTLGIIADHGDETNTQSYRNALNNTIAKLGDIPAHDSFENSIP